MTGCLLTAAYVYERGARRDSKLDLGEIPKKSLITNVTCAIIQELAEATFGIALLMIAGSALADLGERLHCRIPFPTSGIVGWISLLIITDLLGDLINYWLHRAFHRYAWLWPIHRIHHSDEYVNVTSANRGHWLEFAVFQTVQLLPILFLPLTPGIILAFGFFEATRNYFSHIAVPIQLGPVARRIIVSPAAHRLHHSLDPRHFNRNFSATWSIWDRLFGTYADPLESGLFATGADVGDSPKSIIRKSLYPLAIWESEKPELVKSDSPA